MNYEKDDYTPLDWSNKHELHSNNKIVFTVEQACIIYKSNHEVFEEGAITADNLDQYIVPGSTTSVCPR